MRLGAYTCRFTPGTKTAAAYGKTTGIERHRHRYEFQSIYRQAFEVRGMCVAGFEPKRKLVEVIELKDHPWYVGTQYHPELLSRPLHPHLLFVGVLKAGLRRN
jgi:CTP synthase